MRPVGKKGELVENPTLMRLRELEVLEKIASAGHLKVVLGEKGYAPGQRILARGDLSCDCLSP
jgi:hypothetical protein